MICEGAAFQRRSSDSVIVLLNYWVSPPGVKKHGVVCPCRNLAALPLDADSRSTARGNEGVAKTAETWFSAISETDLFAAWPFGLRGLRGLVGYRW